MQEELLEQVNVRNLHETKNGMPMGIPTKRVVPEVAFQKHKNKSLMEAEVSMVTQQHSVDHHLLYHLASYHYQLKNQEEAVRVVEDQEVPLLDQKVKMVPMAGSLLFPNLGKRHCWMGMFQAYPKRYSFYPDIHLHQDFTQLHVPQLFRETGMICLGITGKNLGLGNMIT